MTVILVLGTFTVFLVLDYFVSRKNMRVTKGTYYTAPGFEALGCLAQDGGEEVKKK